MAMQALANCGADVLLAGHLHIIHTGHSSARTRSPATARSSSLPGLLPSVRGRGEAKSFNLLRVKHPFHQRRALSWQPERSIFTPSSTEHFRPRLTAAESSR